MNIMDNIDKNIEKYILIEELFESIDYINIFQITPYVNNLVLTLATLRETDNFYDFTDVVAHIKHLIVELQTYQKMLPEGKEWEWVHIENVIQTLYLDIKKINCSIFTTDISEMMENLDI
jgi:hypothetical protein